MRRILWDVDTQVDFMLPEGKLYVPGAEEVAPAMGSLVVAARAAGLVHVASADDHELTDPELSAEPDFSSTYPPHCLRIAPMRALHGPFHRTECLSRELNRIVSWNPPRPKMDIVIILNRLLI